MKLVVLGSSSAGNCYLFQNKGKVLVIEAGLSTAEVKKALNYETSKIAAVVCSHEHGDHAAHVGEFKQMFAPIFMPRNTRLKEGEYTKIQHGKTYSVCGFNITAYAVKHDVECFSYLIKCEGERILFITDTCGFPYTIDGVSNILIEANYDVNILKSNIANGMPLMHAKRVIEAHMNLDNAIDVCQRIKNERLKRIVLLHLSDSNSDSNSFVEKMQSRTGIATYIAEKGLNLEL